jgi:hypothetical protein
MTERDGTNGHFDAASADLRCRASGEGSAIRRLAAARAYWEGLSAHERVGRFPYLNCTADWSRLGGFGRMVLLADVERREAANDR